MGIFGQIYGAVHGPQLRRKQFALERSQANARVMDIENQMTFRRSEDPREQAQLNQSLWGRGLGMSTIHDQDMSRLQQIQKLRMDSLNNAYGVALNNRRYVEASINYQRKSQYAGYLDAIVGVAGAIGSGGATAGMGGDSTQTAGMGGGGGYDSGNYGFDSGSGSFA